MGSLMALPQPALFRNSCVLVSGILTTDALGLTRMGRQRDEKSNVQLFRSPPEQVNNSQNAEDDNSDTESAGFEDRKAGYNLLGGRIRGIFFRRGFRGRWGLQLCQLLVATSDDAIEPVDLQHLRFGQFLFGKRTVG